MTPKTTFRSAVGWTHKLDTEKQQLHDFNNLILEFRYAVERQDRMLMEYCDRELGRMYKEKGQKKGQKKGQR